MNLETDAQKMSTDSVLQITLQIVSHCTEERLVEIMFGTKFLRLIKITL